MLKNHSEEYHNYFICLGHSIHLHFWYFSDDEAYLFNKNGQNAYYVPVIVLMNINVLYFSK